MKKAPNKIAFAVFFLLLLVLPLITILTPKKSFSETENRALEEFPAFSIENVLSRKFMKNLEEYISDHFIGRTGWTASKTRMELASGKRESNGVFILPERLAEKQDPVDTGAVEKSITAINNFAEDTDMPVFVMIAPTATEIYNNELPKNAPRYDEKAFIRQDVYENLNAEIIALDAYGALYSTRSDYIFYRNDHHWTSLGAYNVYAATIKQMGYSAVPWSRFDIEHATNSFRGTLYSKSLYDGIEADTIDLYTYAKGAKVTAVDINDGRETKIYGTMYFREYLNHAAKYSVFFGVNQPTVTVHTDLKDGPKLLMFKDSYAHSYVPFLAQHYSEITMVDLRYLNNAYKDILEIEEYDQTLFLYSCSTFATDSTIKKLDIQE